MNTLSSGLVPELISILVGAISVVVGRLIQKYLPGEARVLLPAVDKAAAEIRDDVTPKGDGTV